MFRRIQLLLAAASIGCGSGADVLYVGSALNEAGAPSFPEAGMGGVPDARVEAGLLDRVCTPAVDFQNLDPTGGGKVFTDAIQNPVVFLQSVAQRVCHVLYTSPAAVPFVPKITYVIAPLQPPVTGTTGGDTTTISSSYLAFYASSHGEVDTVNEITGITIQHFTSIYDLYQPNPTQQMPDALAVLSGINIFARYTLGYLPIADRQKGGAWNDGRETTAFFFVYLDMQYPNFVRRLNAAIANGYDVSVFQTLTGKDVNALWTQYQASF